MCPHIHITSHITLIRRRSVVYSDGLLQDRRINAHARDSCSMPRKAHMRADLSSIMPDYED